MVMLQYEQLRYTWRPIHINGEGSPDLALSRKIEHRLEKFCHDWEKTPYVSGQQMAGQGTDCVRFWAAQVDYLYGYKRIAPERLPQDYSMHTRTGAMSTLKKIWRLYPELRRVRGPYLEPGDTLVVGYKNGGPGHVMTVGVQHNTLWHAVQNAGVCWTGWALQKDYQKVVAVFRFNNREEWGKGWRTS